MTEKSVVPATRETLERLRREIEAERNSSVRMIGWHMYWDIYSSLHREGESRAIDMTVSYPCDQYTRKGVKL